MADAEREHRCCDYEEGDEGSPEPGSVSSANRLGRIHERKNSASQLVQAPHVSRLLATLVIAAR
jgi:hypothetical protein